MTNEIEVSGRRADDVQPALTCHKGCLICEERGGVRVFREGDYVAMATEEPGQSRIWRVTQEPRTSSSSVPLRRGLEGEKPSIESSWPEMLRHAEPFEGMREIGQRVMFRLPGEHESHAALGDIGGRDFYHDGRERTYSIQHVRSKQMHEVPESLVRSPTFAEKMTKEYGGSGGGISSDGTGEEMTGRPLLPVSRTTQELEDAVLADVDYAALEARALAECLANANAGTLAAADAGTPAAADAAQLEVFRKALGVTGVCAVCGGPSALSFTSITCLRARAGMTCAPPKPPEPDGVIPMWRRTVRATAWEKDKGEPPPEIVRTDVDPSTDPRGPRPGWEPFFIAFSAATPTRREITAEHPTRDGAVAAWRAVVAKGGHAVLSTESPTGRLPRSHFAESLRSAFADKDERLLEKARNAACGIVRGTDTSRDATKGSTYHHREAIRAFCGRWVVGHKVWFVPLRMMSRLAARLRKEQVEFTYNTSDGRNEILITG